MSAFFDKGMQLWAQGSIAWKASGGDTIKVTLADANDFAKQITGATNATPIVITSNSHGYSNGDRVVIFGVGGNTNANGVFKVANVTTNTFELTNQDTGANIAGNAAYTSGGQAINVTVLDFIDDIPSGARIATATLTLIDPAIGGVLDANDVTFTSVTGDQSEVLIIWKDTGTEATSPLLIIFASATGLPLTPDGNNVTLTWDNGASKIARL